MARIPIYQEQETLAQNVAVKELRAPDMGARFIGQGVAQMGKAMGDVAQTMMSIEDERAKTWAADTASKAREEWQLRVKTMQETDTEGGANFTAKVAKEFDAWSEKTMKTAPNGVSQNYLRNSLRNLNDSVKTSALQYEVTEGRTFRMNQMKDSITTDARVLGNNPDPVLAATIIGEKDAAIDALAITSSQKAELKQLARLTIGRTGIEAMVRNQPGVVLAQMDQARRDKSKSSGNQFLDMIPATEWDTHYKAAQNSTNNLQVAAKADELWAKLGPKSDLDTMSPDVIAQAAREAYPDSPAQAASLQALLLDRVKLAELGRKSRNDAREGAVWKAANEGKSLAEIQALPQMKEMPPQDQAKLLTQIQSGRNSTTITPSQNAAYQALLNDPERLANMPDNEFNKQLGVLGSERFKDAQNKRGELQRNPKALEDAKLDNDDFKDMVRFAGLDPESKNETVVGRVGSMRSKLERRLTSEQNARKRALNREEKNAIARQIIQDEVVFVDEWGSDPKIPYAALRPQDKASAYVTVNDKKFSIGRMDQAKIDVITGAWLNQKDEKGNLINRGKTANMMPMKLLIEDYIARYGYPQ